MILQFLGKEVKLVKLFKNLKTGVYEEPNLSSNKS